MEFHIAARATGKTHDLVEWAVNQPPGEIRLIVTHNAATADVLRQQHAALIEPWRVVSIHHLLKSGAPEIRDEYRASNVIFGIDDLDLVLGELLHARVGRVTSLGSIVQSGENF